MKRKCAICGKCAKFISFGQVSACGMVIAKKDEEPGGRIEKFGNCNRKNVPEGCLMQAEYNIVNWNK